MVDTEVEENVMCPEFSNQASCVWLAEVGSNDVSKLKLTQTRQDMRQRGSVATNACCKLGLVPCNRTQTQMQSMLGIVVPMMFWIFDLLFLTPASCVTCA